MTIDAARKSPGLPNFIQSLKSFKICQPHPYSNTAASEPVRGGQDSCTLKTLAGGLQYGPGRGQGSPAPVTALLITLA